MFGGAHDDDGGADDDDGGADDDRQVCLVIPDSFSDAGCTR